MTEDVNFVQRARREKLDQLVARGIQPFAYSYRPSHDCSAALAAMPDASEEGPPVRLAGRLVSWRAHGKTAFAHLADESGRLQLYFRKDALGDDAFAALDLLDIGDVCGVEGHCSERGLVK
jgi:lysyl-tRNA synthetase, class II